MTLFCCLVNKHSSTSYDIPAVVCTDCSSHIHRHATYFCRRCSRRPCRSFTTVSFHPLILKVSALAACCWCDVRKPHSNWLCDKGIDRPLMLPVNKVEVRGCCQDVMSCPCDCSYQTSHHAAGCSLSCNETQ